MTEFTEQTLHNHYGSDHAEFKYGPDRSRIKQTSVTGSTTDTIYYIGPHFEKEVKGGVTSYRHYVWADGRAIAVYTRPSSGPVTTRYLHRNHLNSVVAVSDDAGSVQQTMSFDAFGKRRNSNWTADTGDAQFGVSHLTERGFTGHEHLDNVRLIHMNGRVQDPILGRMISADPTIPDPFSSQSFNRYSYVVNNPLSLIDPTGFEEGDDDYTPPTFCERNWPICHWEPDPPDMSITERDITALDALDDAWNCSKYGDCEDENKDNLPDDGSTSPWPAAIAAGVGTIADDATGVGAVDDVLVPAVLAAAVAYDLTHRTYVTYTLTNPAGKIYVGRASGFGTPQQIADRRYASHAMRATGYGRPIVDKSAQGQVGRIAIRGREQQLINHFGGIGSPKLGNAIRGVSKLNPFGKIYSEASDASFGSLEPYDGYF